MKDQKEIWNKAVNEVCKTLPNTKTHHSFVYAAIYKDIVNDTLYVNVKDVKGNNNRKVLEVIIRTKDTEKTFEKDIYYSHGKPVNSDYIAYAVLSQCTDKLTKEEMILVASAYKVGMKEV